MPVKARRSDLEPWVWVSGHGGGGDVQGCSQARQETETPSQQGGRGEGMGRGGGGATMHCPKVFGQLGRTPVWAVAPALALNLAFVLGCGRWLLSPVLGTAFWVTCEPSQVRACSALELLGVSLMHSTQHSAYAKKVLNHI